MAKKCSSYQISPAQELQTLYQIMYTGVERTSLNYGKVRGEDGKIETRHQESSVLQEERSLQWDTNFTRYRKKVLLSASSARL
jgi:hypothetical protein